MHMFWEAFEGASYWAQMLTLLQLAVTIWMLVDAYQRGAEAFWYWIILLFQPIGAWVYFFAVKLRTFRLPGLRFGPGWQRRMPLDELRYRVERTPTLANRFELAGRLMEQGAHAEAIPLLEAVLAIESDYCAALHALGLCWLATGPADKAVAPLEKLIQRDPRWSNYYGFRTLINAHLARKQPTDALTVCRELVKRQPTLENKCLLAEHLLDNGQPPEVVKLLGEALEDYRYSSMNVRWKHWRWAREARGLLAEAQKSAPSKKVAASK